MCCFRHLVLYWVGLRIFHFQVHSYGIREDTLHHSQWWALKPSLKLLNTMKCSSKHVAPFTYMPPDFYPLKSLNCGSLALLNFHDLSGNVHDCWNTFSYNLWNGNFVLSPKKFTWQLFNAVWKNLVFVYNLQSKLFWHSDNLQSCLTKI